MPTLTITRLFNSSGDRKFPNFFFCRTLAIFLEILLLVKVSVLYLAKAAYLNWELAIVAAISNKSHPLIAAAPDSTALRPPMEVFILPFMYDIFKRYETCDVYFH